MRAFLNLRYTNDRRAKLFEKGLRAIGYEPVHGFPAACSDSDIFVTWNRIGQADSFAKQCIARGVKVIVAENASWGNKFAGQNWFQLARNFHNTARMAPYNGPERFDQLRIPLLPWRESGETVILPQRGIGSKPVAMPKAFAARMHKKYGARVRKHPGMHERIPLESDLANCGRVITWGSGAAIKALTWGIPVISYYQEWVGTQNNTDEGRLEMFRRLAWSQWTYSEIKSGEAFTHLLNYSVGKTGIGSLPKA